MSGSRLHIDMVSIEAHLRLAMEQEIGVAVPCEPREQYRNLFYELRKKLAVNEPELNGLILFVPARGGEVFICKKQVDLDAK